MSICSVVVDEENDVIEYGWICLRLAEHLEWDGALHGFESQRRDARLYESWGLTLILRECGVLWPWDTKTVVRLECDYAVPLPSDTLNFDDEVMGR